MTTPYWLDDAGDRQIGSRRLTADPDVDIVGAGVTGLSCALTLAQAGVRVRVHDARGVAGGASGRNAGFALRGAALPYDEARLALGAAAARELWALTERALVRLAGLAGEAFRAEGSLRLAVDAQERDRLLVELAALQADGFAVEWREPPVGGCGHRRFTGALFHPTDGAIHPVHWLRRLAAAAAAAGAEIRERSPVAALADLAAPQLVIATDGYGAGLLPELDQAIRPARGQVIATEPLPERIVACPHYAREGYDYWQQLPDWRLVVGGFRDTAPEAEATREDGTTPEVQARLEELAAAVAGFAPRITHRWSGVWGETRDRLPLAGPVPGRPGVWVAAGYSGHGNVLGLACGDLVARALLGAPVPELAPFAPSRLLGSELARCDSGRHTEPWPTTEIGRSETRPAD